MKLILDQGLPRTAVTHLADYGIDSEHVGDLGMSTAADSEIVAEAVRRKAVLVSLDSDFHAILAESNAQSPSVIRIRIEGLKGEELAALLAAVTQSARSELEAGAVVSVVVDRIRVRLLPLGN